jgi:hypothetical protein
MIPGLIRGTLVSLQFLNLKKASRTPWTGDQPVARMLPTHRTAQTQKNANIHVSSGIRTQFPSVRAWDDISCLGPRGLCNRLLLLLQSTKLFSLRENGRIYFRPLQNKYILIHFSRKFQFSVWKPDFQIVFWQIQITDKIAEVYLRLYVRLVRITRWFRQWINIILILYRETILILVITFYSSIHVFGGLDSGRS